MFSQIPLSFPRSKSSLEDSFILHSGIAETYLLLCDCVEKLQAGSTDFFYFSLSAPKGAGATYLLSLLDEKVMGSCRFVFFDHPSDWTNDEFVSRFVTAYEETKSQGGLLVLVNPHSTDNPHLQSRLRAALALEITYPSETELRAMVNALLDERGLKFDERKLSFLLERAPSSPLSLSTLLARIDGLSLREGKQLTRGVIQEALTSFEQSRVEEVKNEVNRWEKSRA